MYNNVVCFRIVTYVEDWVIAFIFVLIVDLSCASKFKPTLTQWFNDTYSVIIAFTIIMITFLGD